ncbi:MAG: hypothetical protein SGPRY_008569 [Prymnesium sp.]
MRPAVPPLARPRASFGGVSLGVLSLERITIGAGLCFLLLNLLVIAYFLPNTSHHHVERAGASSAVHGLTADSLDLWSTFPSVAFFVLPGEAAAVVPHLRRTQLRNVHLLWQELGEEGNQPMANDVINPRGRRLTALQALQTSNEFFDLQIIHSRPREQLSRALPSLPQLSLRF